MMARHESRPMVALRERARVEGRDIICYPTGVLRASERRVLRPDGALFALGQRVTFVGLLAGGAVEGTIVNIWPLGGPVGVGPRGVGVKVRYDWRGQGIIRQVTPADLTSAE